MRGRVGWGYAAIESVVHREKTVSHGESITGVGSPLPNLPVQGEERRAKLRPLGHRYDFLRRSFRAQVVSLGVEVAHPAAVFEAQVTQELGGRVEESTKVG